MDWSSDAVNGFGFICNSGKAKVSDLSPALCPSLLLGKEGDLAILEDVRADTIYSYSMERRAKNESSQRKSSKSGIQESSFLHNPHLKNTKL